MSSNIVVFSATDKISSEPLSGYFSGLACMRKARFTDMLIYGSHLKFVAKDLVQERFVSWSVWLEQWKSGKMKNCERMEKWENGKYLVFSRVCLVGGMKKWEDGKLFCLVKKKSGRIEKVIYIN